MKIELVDYTKEAEEKIARYSAICYDADTGPDANARRIQKLINLGHLATLRFAHAVFRVDGISRTCSHQFVRSKHLDFLQESQRYVNQDGIDFIIPDSIANDNHCLSKWLCLESLSREVYRELRTRGVKKEDARFALLEAAPTRMYVSGNFQAWLDFLKNRADKSAQWEIREVAEQIGNELFKVAPNVFKDYGKEKAT